MASTSVGPPPGAGPVERLLDGRIAGDRVHTVDGHAGHAVALRPLVDVGLRHLARERRGDRPLVVLAEKDDRQPVDRRKVERLVPFAFAGAAVAERGQTALPVALRYLIAYAAPTACGSWAAMIELIV